MGDAPGAPDRGWGSSLADGVATDAPHRDWGSSLADGVATDAPDRGWGSSLADGVATDAPNRDWGSSPSCENPFCLPVRESHAESASGSSFEGKCEAGCCRRRNWISTDSLCSVMFFSAFQVTLS